MPAGPVCGKCQAPLLWACTLKGKMQPLNRDPDPAGNIRLTGNWRQSPKGALPECAVILKAERLELFAGGGEAEERYMPHHATCEHAAEFRRPKKAS